MLATGPYQVTSMTDLADMNVRTRTDDVDFHVGIPLIPVPTKSPLILPAKIVIGCQSNASQKSTIPTMSFFSKLLTLAKPVTKVFSVPLRSNPSF